VRPLQPTRAARREPPIPASRRRPRRRRTTCAAAASSIDCRPTSRPWPPCVHEPPRHSGGLAPSRRTHSHARWFRAPGAPRVPRWVDLVLVHHEPAAGGEPLRSGAQEGRLLLGVGQHPQRGRRGDVECRPGTGQAGHRLHHYDLVDGSLTPGRAGASHDRRARTGRPSQRGGLARSAAVAGRGVLPRRVPGRLGRAHGTVMTTLPRACPCSTRRRPSAVSASG
jgi:hypothetical protein